MLRRWKIQGSLDNRSSNWILPNSVGIMGNLGLEEKPNKNSNKTKPVAVVEKERTIRRTRHIQGPGGRSRVRTMLVRTTTLPRYFTDTFRTGTSKRSGQRAVITERFDRTSMGDRVLNRDVIHHHAF